MNVKIEKGIPRPKRKWGKFSQIAEDMDFADSVLVKSRHDADRLRFALYNSGYKASIRKMEKDKFSKLHTYRVWKLENK